MLTMDIRILRPADAAEYRELRLRALREHPEALTSGYEEESQKSIDTTKTRLSPKSGNTFWGAFLNEVLVGMYVAPDAVCVAGQSYAKEHLYLRFT